jgi:hypothetical protein
LVILNLKLLGGQNIGCISDQIYLCRQRAQVGTVPFGPTGFRPPTCGGPGSGYVCCRAGAASTTDFNEINQENTIRDTRQQPNQVNTKNTNLLEHCKRNS